MGPLRRREVNGRRVLWAFVVAAGLFMAARAGGVGVEYEAGERGVLIAGVDSGRPMIYDNDWWGDTPDKNYLWAKASTGRADLRGNIVTRDMWDWQKGYLYKIEQGLDDARKSIEIARRAGLRNIPDAVAGCERVFERPASGKIEDTKVIRSAGSELIVAEARKARKGSPLLVFVGGPLNTVANAYLMDPSIAEKTVVFMTDLRGYNGKDAWANYIVASRCRLVNYGAHIWWPQRPAPPVMPLGRFGDLPQNEQTKELYRIAKNFWDRSTRKNRPDRDDGFADGAPVFLVFNPKTWKQVQRQKVEGVFGVRDVRGGEYDLLDARNVDYGLMSEEFFSVLKEPGVYSGGTSGGGPKEKAGKAGVMGPLAVCKENRRYFENTATGKVVYLTGAHTWSNLVDMGTKDPPDAFDYDGCLDWMEELGHNFMRMWTWELVTWNTKGNRENKLHTIRPVVWARTGPGKALDGKPKFDLEKLNPEYFARLAKRVAAARDRGIYVSVMLFEGWGLQFSPGAWEGHPFNPKNNINGIDGDANGDGKGVEVHTLSNKKVTALQEAYVRRIIDTVNRFDNVLYEISNENHPASTQWQYHIIRYIKKYEKGKGQQHPVGMTFQYRGGKNETLFSSPADWVSPNPEGGYRDNPPAADGRKVVISDTDHLWGIGGNQSWVWKSFTRGYNPIFMDPYDGVVLGRRFDSKWEPIRRSLGYTLKYAGRMDLVKMVPRGGLSSTGYCLANPGREYLVYNPAGDKRTVRLDLKGGMYGYEWFDPGKGEAARLGRIETKGGREDFKAPFAGEAVLYVYRVKTRR